jgi:NADPH:quinone reductase-like Zn-dependent oxidoreductase
VAGVQAPAAANVVRAGLLVLDGNGSIGALAAQLAVARGAAVISAVRASDIAAVTVFGAVPIDYRRPLRDSVRSPVDAVLDASGRADLPGAVTPPEDRTA